MTKTKLRETSPSDALRLRVVELKRRLPENFEYTPIYQYEFGKMTPAQIAKVRAVWNLRDVDEEITSNLEHIANNYAKK